jgi:hypothetical protein
LDDAGRIGVRWEWPKRFGLLIAQAAQANPLPAVGDQHHQQHNRERQAGMPLTKATGIGR